MRYLPHTEEEIKQMLQTAGAGSVEELFASIPKPLQHGKPLALGEPMSELETLRKVESLADENKSFAMKRFLSAGYPSHFAPSFIDQTLLRSEFYTAYTPYQPEISQGTLQGIFEFQSMTAALLGLDVANASMYDGATATAEAALMAKRVLKDKRKKVILVKNVHPEWREVVHTYLVESGEHIVEVDFDHATGLTDRTAIAAQLDADAACVIASLPSFFGTVEDFTDLAKAVHDNGSLLIIAVPEPVALGEIKSPGQMGADIAVGDGIGLLGALNFGGPGVGLFATKKEYVRQMPGRLAGVTTDANGRRGFVLTLATREQHIRREKATSNICTNHGLMALAFSMALAWWGKNGLPELSRQNRAKFEYLKGALAAKGVRPAFTGACYNEAVFKINGNARETVERLAETKGVIAGFPLSYYYPQLGDDLLLTAVNELATKEDIDELISLL